MVESVSENYMPRAHERSVAAVDLDNILWNLRELKRRAGRDDILTCCAVKADAYGHGAARVSKAVEAETDYFAVATLYEAVELRDSGISKPILILGRVFGEDYETAILNDISLTLFDLEEARALNKEAESLGRAARVHIAVDTGMSRIGLMPDEEGADTVKSISELPFIEADGVFTHFATADMRDKTGVYRALELFRSFKRKCERKGAGISIWHCANTASVIDRIGLDSDFDMMRIGIGLYGLYPSDEVDKRSVFLKPALSWYAYLTCVKKIRAGTSVSYGYNYTAERDMLIGTVCCGYADGYPRILYKRGGEVLIGGRHCPVIGNICMDQFMVALDGVPEAKAGDKVTLIGCDGGAVISADDIAKMTDTINYEITCGISRRNTYKWISGQAAL